MRHRVAISIAIGGLLLGVIVGRELWSRLGRSGPVEPGGVEYVRFTEEVMAAPIEVVVPADHGEAAARLVFDTFHAVDRDMSEWKPTSPLSAVNAAAGGDGKKVPADLRAVIRRGIEIGDLTDGAFDITWAALWGLWDFKAEAPGVPDDAEIDERLPLVDFRLIEIDDEAGTVRLPKPGMKIGLGGIAKGHALDRAAAALRERGVDSFLISAGGQMMVGGSRGDRPWRIGIRDPRGGPTDMFAWIEVTDTSVASSGDYERFFILGGVRYHHILDPRTGRPARGVRGATVIADDATLADALATAIVILGTHSGLQLIEGLDGVEGVIVDDQATAHVSSGLVGRLRELESPRQSIGH